MADLRAGFHLTLLKVQAIPWPRRHDRVELTEARDISKFQSSLVHSLPNVSKSRRFSDGNLGSLKHRPMLAPESAAGPGRGCGAG
jgi:hypothetical protein